MAGFSLGLRRQSAPLRVAPERGGQAVVKCALIACLAAFIPAHLRADARADDGWTLITSDFNRQPVAVISLDEHGLRITRPGQPNAETLPLAQFLHVTRPAATPA